MTPEHENTEAPSGAPSEQAPPPAGAAPVAEPMPGEQERRQAESAAQQDQQPVDRADQAAAPESEDEAASAEIGARADAEALRPDALAELRERAAKADEYLDLAQRTQADFENFRKRMTRDLQAAEARGTVRLARELLPALDNLERALAAVEASEADANANANAHPHADADAERHMTSGFRLVKSELAAALNRTGIEGFTPMGEPFDPSEHEAVAQQPVQGAETGTIVEVLQAGYRMNGAILRPARVIVAG